MSVSASSLVCVLWLFQHSVHRITLMAGALNARMLDDWFIHARQRSALFHNYRQLNTCLLVNCVKALPHLQPIMSTVGYVQQHFCLCRTSGVFRNLRGGHPPPSPADPQLIVWHHMDVVYETHDERLTKFPGFVSAKPQIHYLISLVFHVQLWIMFAHQESLYSYDLKVGPLSLIV